MKIAIDISQVLYGTGVSVYTRNLVTVLSKIVPTSDQLTVFGGSLRRRHELNLFAARLNNITQKNHFLSPRVLHLLWNNFHFLNAEVFTGDVDLIHTSDWAEPPSKFKKVTTVHDLSFFRDPSFVQPYVRQVHTKRLYWVAKESAKIIAVSQATKKDLIKYLEIDPCRIEVIYEGPSILSNPVVSLPVQEKILKRYRITKPFFFVPGSGHPRKNLVRLVSAFKKTKLDHQLFISGRPSPEELKLQSDRVIFGGFIPDSDWAQLISASQALLYPSLYEGFGVPILDAFVCGVPVVTSNVSSLPEVAAQAGVLVDPQDTDSIASGIIASLAQKNDLIKAGTKRLESFSWEKTAQETLKLYHDILNY